MSTKKKEDEVTITSQEFTNEQIKEVSVSMSQKISTGQYETRDIFMSARLELLPGQVPEQAMLFLRKKIEFEVGTYYNKVKENLIKEKQ